MEHSRVLLVAACVAAVLIASVAAAREMPPRVATRDALRPHWQRHVEPRVALVALEDGPGLRARRAATAWAAPNVVRALAQVGRRCAQEFPGARPIWVHDLSRREGGKLAGHHSHRVGLDADIRLPMRRPGPYIDATPRTLDLRRTWCLLRALVETCEVEFILLDRRLQAALFKYAIHQRYAPRQRFAPFDLERVLEYPQRPTSPRPDRVTAAVVRHFRRHANHIHVRCREARQPLRVLAARELCHRPAPGGRRPAAPETL